MNDPEPICSISGNKDRIMRQNATSTTYYLYDREDRARNYDSSDDLGCGIISPTPTPKPESNHPSSSIISRGGRQYEI